METQIQKTREIFSKDLEELKGKEMKNTIIKMKNSIEGLNSRITKEEVSWKIELWK